MSLKSGPLKNFSILWCEPNNVVRPDSVLVEGIGGDKLRRFLTIMGGRWQRPKKEIEAELFRNDVNMLRPFVETIIGPDSVASSNAGHRLYDILYSKRSSSRAIRSMEDKLN